jgi:hypothetical protein
MKINKDVRFRYAPQNEGLFYFFEKFIAKIINN